MVAAAFCYNGCTRVTYTEALACHTVDKGCTACCSKEGNVTYDDIAVGSAFEGSRFFDYNFTAAKAFTKGVVGVAGEAESEALWNKGTKALARTALKINNKGIVTKSIAVALLDFGTENCSNSTVC